MWLRIRYAILNDSTNDNPTNNCSVDPFSNLINLYIYSSVETQQLVWIRATLIFGINLHALKVKVRMLQYRFTTAFTKKGFRTSFLRYIRLISYQFCVFSAVLRSAMLFCVITAHQRYITYVLFCS